MIHEKGAYRRLFLLALVSPALFQPLLLTAGQSCSTNLYDDIATVSSVHDGDTVRLKDGRKIRLIGINAPEMARDNRPEQAFAANARDQLKRLLAESNNQVKLVYGTERLDRYKRTLAHLFLPDNQNLQEILLKQGLATANVYPPNVAFTGCYQRAEQGARCKSVGIWSDNDYAIKSSADLDPVTEGFRRVSGLVERVNESRKGLWLFLQGGLMISIHTEDLARFDTDELKSLSDKKITVRGWLAPRKKTKNRVKFHMRLRHPSAITATGTTDNVTKC